MIEVAVAIGVIAILAGAATPLALKALNQQREHKTRENLKVAYEALYGVRDRRVSNMAADFGFAQNPAAASPVDLRFMTTRNAPNGSGAIPQPYGSGATFFWGWNGPYWTGATTPAAATAGIPVDGWGRAIRLYNGPRLVSAGVDGLYLTPDDIVFPTTVGPLPVSTLVVNLNRQNPGTPAALTAGNVTVTIVHRANGSAPALAPLPSWQPTWLAVNGSQNRTWNPNPGPVSITITTPSITSSQQVVDLLPGQSQIIDFKFSD